MNLDLNLIDGLRDFLDADRDNDAPGLQDVKWNIRDWVKERMVEAWEQPDKYTLTVTDLLESLTQIEEFGTDGYDDSDEYKRGVRSVVNAIRERVGEWSARNSTG